MGEGNVYASTEYHKNFIKLLSLSHVSFALLDIMLTTIPEARLGRDRSLYLLDGKFVETQEVEFITLIIIQEAPRGKGQILKDYSISNIGKVKGNM